MLKSIRLFLFIALLSSSNLAIAQVYFEEPTQKEGVDLLEQKKYKEAYQVFKRLLSSEEVVDPDFPFYFAKTLYHLDRFQNSKNFLQQYLSTERTNATFYREALVLQSNINKALTTIQQCTYCNANGLRLISCDYCHGAKKIKETCIVCNGKGISHCKKCGGEGVIISRNNFNENQYLTCDKCTGKGYHTCITCAGNKIIDSNCPECMGSGLKKSSIVCDHTSTQTHDH